MNEVKKVFNDAKKIIDDNRRYIIISEKLLELKEGKTDVYLSTITPYTRQYLNEIFKGKRCPDKKTLIKILEPMISESVKLKEKYEKYGINKFINYFFKEI